MDCSRQFVSNLAIRLQLRVHHNPRTNWRHTLHVMTHCVPPKTYSPSNRFGCHIPQPSHVVTVRLGGVPA
jgi:hypothetical protein